MQALVDKLRALGVAEEKAKLQKEKEKQDKQDAAATGKDQKKHLQEAQDRAAVLNGLKTEYQLRIEMIERQRVADEQRIRNMQGISEELRNQLLLQNNNIAAQEKANENATQQNELVGKLAGFLENLWNDPMAAMKQFFSELLKELLIAILKAIILKQTLPGGGSIGGLIGNAIMGAIGARAAGGSIDPNKPYVVGEQGPEVFFPGRAGQVLSHRDSFGGGGSGSAVTLAPTYNIQVSSDAQQNARTLAQIKMQQREQNQTIHNQMNNKGWRK